MNTYEQIRNRIAQLMHAGCKPPRRVDSFGQIVDGEIAAALADAPGVSVDGSLGIGWLATEYMHAGEEWSVSASLRAENVRGVVQFGIELVRTYNLTAQTEVTDLAPGEAYAAMRAITKRLAGKGGRVEDYEPGVLLTVPHLVALEALERTVYMESVISLKVSGMDAVLMPAPAYTHADGAGTIVDAVHVAAGTYARFSFGNDIVPEDVADNVLREIRHRLRGVAGALAVRTDH